MAGYVWERGGLTERDKLLRRDVAPVGRSMQNTARFVRRKFRKIPIFKYESVAL